MKALTWHGKRDVRIDEVPDPTIQEPTDAIIRVTSTAICGSDLHLSELFGPFIDEGDILGHEPMGIVEEVGHGVTDLAPGDRVVDGANGHYREAMARAPRLETPSACSAASHSRMVAGGPAGAAGVPVSSAVIRWLLARA